MILSFLMRHLFHLSLYTLHPPSLVPFTLSNQYLHATSGAPPKNNIPFEVLISSDVRVLATWTVLADVGILPRILADTKIPVRIPAAIRIPVRLTASIMVSPGVKILQWIDSGAIFASGISSASGLKRQFLGDLIRFVWDVFRQAIFPRGWFKAIPPAEVRPAGKDISVIVD